MDKLSSQPALTSTLVLPNILPNYLGALRLGFKTTDTEAANRRTPKEITKSAAFYFVCYPRQLYAHQMRSWLQ